MRRWTVLPLIAVCLATTTSLFAEQACDGLFKDKKPTEEQIAKVLEDHQAWLRAGRLDGDERRANLCNADLGRADLRDAHLSEAKLSGIDLWRADLTGAGLGEAELIGAYLRSANLGGAYLQEANLSRADLSGAKLNKATLFGANLSGALFFWDNETPGSDLSDTDLKKANLSDAKLYGVDLSGANLYGAKLWRATFEPSKDSELYIDSIAEAEGLHTLQWNESPRALFTLRAQFRNGGYRFQERQITYALKHADIMRKWEGREKKGESSFPRIDAAFNYLLFELTTEWGMRPGRALVLLLSLIPIFAPFYAFAVWEPKRDGIWRIWSSKRAREDIGTNKPELMTAGLLGAIGLGLYFSLLSAFHIGWQQYNVGNWISRIQPREYTLQASGWVRSISGIQSLISVLLLALWAYTYFGRPFQ